MRPLAPLFVSLLLHASGCGISRRCSSGNHTTHHAGKDAYAYDFAMPVGSPVRAMRAGTVLRTRLPSPAGSPCHDGGDSSCANYANTVEVRHADGTVGLYMHLSSLSVSKGSAVAQGDVLGASGNSGWSTGPHLHVQVQSDCGTWWCPSVPFTFQEGSVATGTSLSSGNCP
jgi:murein DD-endopeptidase MepM/ murein hydrolase activator NlpD